MWASALIATISTALAFLPSDLPRRASILAARLRGYDGCLCADCGREFGFIGYSYGGCRCGTARGDTAGVAIIGWLTAAAVLGVALQGPGRGPPEGRCRGCGYDLAGLPPQSRCPECGAGPSSRSVPRG